jgi:hypothetical protein
MNAHSLKLKCLNVQLHTYLYLQIIFKTIVNKFKHKAWQLILSLIAIIEYGNDLTQLITIMYKQNCFKEDKKNYNSSSVNYGLQQNYFLFFGGTTSQKKETTNTWIDKWRKNKTNKQKVGAPRRYQPHHLVTSYMSYFDLPRRSHITTTSL